MFVFQQEQSQKRALFQFRAGPHVATIFPTRKEFPVFLPVLLAEANETRFRRGRAPAAEWQVGGAVTET